MAKNLSQKMKELDGKVEWFNSSEFELDKAMEKYEEALALTKEIEEDLQSLKNEIQVLEEDFSK